MPDDIDLVDNASTAERAQHSNSPLLSMRGIDKSFGITRAVRQVDFSIGRAEVVGLMGGNGAGKSTLMKIVGGLLAPDAGTLEIAGHRTGADHSPRDAMALGIRFVHQELSLCPNLRVFENFAIELPDVINGLHWRRIAINQAKAALDDVFPGNTLDPRSRVSNLSLSQQQMVEIARAASHPTIRLLILDEPTSSLAAREADQLRAYVKRRRAEGLSFIFISHRLRETLDLADRIVLMRNGAGVWNGLSVGLSQDQLLELLGGTAGNATMNNPQSAGVSSLVEVDNLVGDTLSGVTLKLGRGEILGLAGLEGSGQRELLRSVFDWARRPDAQINVKGRVAFVSGDRVREGIFALWSIDDNIAISSLDRLSRWGFVSLHRMRTVTGGWFRRLAIMATDGSARVTSLSGGNQQKVVIARALAAEADVILLDDPTRGVDLDTKAELYRLFRSFADSGHAVLWYSSDDTEFAECDRTLVLRDGVVLAELSRTDATPNRIAEASFRRVETVDVDQAEQRRIDRARWCEAHLPSAIPLATFAMIFALCVSQSPVILSGFGLTLVFSAAFSLGFAAISQLFIIAAGDIDLGIGPFIGLVNAIAATWLVTDPGLAAMCFLVLLTTYPLMGLFVHLRGVPAIIVTLGMSFVWLGFASYRLPRAGGAAPDWLVDLFRLKPPMLPLAVYLCLFPAILAYLVLMVWRYGTVLRGFGASPRAIEAAGWSTSLAKATLYGFAGFFAVIAGIVITASTLGGDPTGATSMTLLSVAAVILGGASFAGGLVAPIGALFGVLTLVLVGTLLSLFEVNGVYLPMVQGLMLLGVVGVRTLLVRKPT